MNKNIKKLLFVVIIFCAYFFTFSAVPTRNFKNSYFEYTKNIKVLNISSLISFPEKAFDKNNPERNTYDTTKITPFEFKKILEELYKNNYILISPKELFDTQSSHIVSKQLLLPQNKKPIILTFDNINYKKTHSNPAEIDKIIIDRNNQPATYSTQKSIRDRIAYDNEFIPILENFIKNKPGFSHNNSRGIIFLNGKNGILGYSTNPRSSNSSSDKKRLSELINNLRTKGWEFGCNNYTFSSTPNTLSDIEFLKDISLWNKEIKPLLGTTPYYLSKEIDYYSKSKIAYLIENNFNILFFENAGDKLTQNNNVILFNYQSVNGHTLRNSPEIFEDAFNCETIYDHQQRFVPFNRINI